MNTIYNYNFKNESFQFYNDNKLLYRSENPFLIRLKCAGLVLATLVATICRVANSLFNGNLKAVCAALKYGFLMELSALQGLVQPKFGRKTYGKYEMRLNGHETEILRVIREGGEIKGLGKRVNERFYLAVCFQPITSINATNRDERLHRYIEHEKNS